MRFTGVLVVTKTKDIVNHDATLLEYFRKIEYQDLELKMPDRDVPRENFASCSGKRCNSIIEPTGLNKMNYYLPL